MKFSFLALLYCLLLHNHVTHSQVDSIPNKQIGIRYSYGFIIPHNKIIEYLANRSTATQELFVEFNTFGHKKWHSRYNHLGIGGAIARYDFNNDEHIGTAYSLAPYFNFKLRGNEKLSLQLRASLGIGYIENIFDKDDNFKNAAIGSTFNMFLALLLEGKWQINNKLGVSSGLSFSHLSNAGFQKPNLGFNIFSLTSSVFYRVGKKDYYRSYTPETYTRKKAYWQVSSGVGLNEISPPNGQKYLANALFIAREKRLNYKSSVGLGMDFFYNPAQKEFLAGEGISINNWQNIQMALSVSHVLHFGRLSFTSQLSYYLKTENEELGKIYHVFGGRGQLNDRLNLFIAGKTHIDKAEYFLIGVGYKLGYEK